MRVVPPWCGQRIAEHRFGAVGIMELAIRNSRRLIGYPDRRCARMGWWSDRPFLGSDNLCNSQRDSIPEESTGSGGHRPAPFRPKLGTVPTTALGILTIIMSQVVGSGAAANL